MTTTTPTPAPENTAFKLGDVVILNSGSRWMTIYKLFNKTHGGEDELWASIVYSDYGTNDLRHDEVPAAALQLRPAR